MCEPPDAKLVNRSGRPCGAAGSYELFPGLAEDELRKQSLPVAIVANPLVFTQQAVDHLAVVELGICAGRLAEARW